MCLINSCLDKKTINKVYKKQSRTQEKQGGNYENKAVYNFDF